MTKESRFPLILMIALSITPVISVYFPRFLAFWPIIIGLVTCFWLIFVKKELFRISRTYYICAGTISVLCLLSVTWSVSPMLSLADALKVTAMLLSGGLLISSFKALEIEDFRPYGWIFAVGILVAATLCAYDLYDGLKIYHLFHVPDDGEINTSVMNRGIICLVFYFFASLPFIQSLNWPDNKKTLLTSATGIIMVVMLVLSQSQAGQVSFLLGLILFFAFPAGWRFSYVLLGLALFATLLSTPFIVNVLYDYLIIDYRETNDFIREAYIGNRVEIWNVVMKYAMNNPLYGYGIEATNYVRDFEFAHLYNKKNTFLHPHNFSVQIWMEFGVIGVIVATALLSALLNALYNIRDVLVRKSLSVVFVLVLLVAAITYSLWQSWWVGEFLFLTGLGTLMLNMRTSAPANAGQSE